VKPSSLILFTVERAVRTLFPKGFPELEVFLKKEEDILKSCMQLNK
jgi:hypothetical protein